jgi:hypothetical protein
LQENVGKRKAKDKRWQNGLETGAALTPAEAEIAKLLQQKIPPKKHLQPPLVVLEQPLTLIQQPHFLQLMAILQHNS